jgi:hypothetical protein
MLVKVTGTPYCRDTNSMLLNNTDTSAREEYYNKVRMVQQQKQELNTMKQDIVQVQSDIGEIKQLLQQLISKQ